MRRQYGRRRANSLWTTTSTEIVIHYKEKAIKASHREDTKTEFSAYLYLGVYFLNFSFLIT